MASPVLDIAGLSVVVGKGRVLFSGLDLSVQGGESVAVTIQALVSWW
ncbi:MAG: hypothetical protein LBJ08_11760 [Bifidobacteriaceae bacterium]|nr:hypothetical protein [Bifidobacteriaceae bacterium]